MDIFQSIGQWFEGIGIWFNDNVIAKFVSDFIVKDRWKYMANGLVVTLEVTVAAVILGIILGFIVSIVRTTHDKTGRFKISNTICQFYLTVIRGTPVLVQLLIIYYIVFASVDINQVLVAIIAFGINSGAYVAEIFRSGIISIDAGQFEAGRSLGFGYTRTMLHIIMPQAIRNVIPALMNEIIALLKETSIVGYIALQDVTRGAMTIRGATFDPFIPLIVLALVYLAIVIPLSAGIRRLERRLRRIER